MNRKAYGISLSVVLVAISSMIGCGGSSSSIKTTPKTVAIAATSGSGQSATVGTAFASPLSATVTTNGNPTAGVTVTFSVPSASNGSFAGGVTTATTNASGVATSPAFTAGATTGSYAVTATATGATAAASFSLTNMAVSVLSITATSGAGQSATVGTAFAAPLVATVTASGTPKAGIVVTFTAPASGGSGSFAGGISTATTDANGQATSAAFTANTKAGTYNVTASITTATPVNFGLTNTAGAAATITATSGSGQNAAVTAAFVNPLVATVVDTYSNPVSGAVVTFTPPSSGASGTFAGANTATTDANGVATSSVFTANATGGGPYTVAAAAPGTAAPANFTLSNANNYTYYLSGVDTYNHTTPENYLALAGTVTIAPDGSVLAGEQDYNDAHSANGGDTSTDTITGGSLTVSPTTGMGTLTLNTTNPLSATESFVVAFVNSKHARIMQFDGKSTSSGSMDLQTPSSTLSGGYSFVASGVDPSYAPVALGGVFVVSGNTIPVGIMDYNQSGVVGTGLAFSANAVISAPDSFGRGTISDALPVPITLAYYMVNQEAIRIIDIDSTDALVGSAFGQGNTTFSKTSVGNSVLALAGNSYSSEYGALAQFTTDTNAETFTGVGEANELDNTVFTGLSNISGSYTMGSSGYGSLTITGGLGGSDVSALGIYATDPALNLNDPNSATGGGGALVLDLDTTGSKPLSGGTGVLIPQTDTTATSFTNNYVAGFQIFATFTVCADCEFDMLSQGSMTAGALSLTGDISDPLGEWSSTKMSTGNSFSGTPLPDGSHLGRYSMLSTNLPTPNPLAVSPAGSQFNSFDLVLYQANGGQLYWLEYDLGFSSVFIGSLEQQGDLNGLPLARKPVGTPRAKQKR